MWIQYKLKELSGSRHAMVDGDEGPSYNYINSILTKH